MVRHVMLMVHSKLFIHAVSHKAHEDININTIHKMQDSKIYITFLQLQD